MTLRDILETGLTELVDGLNLKNERNGRIAAMHMSSARTVGWLTVHLLC